MLDVREADIPVGRRIPSQNELKQETGGLVSRRTIRSAIELLQAEGTVQGVQGKGVFVIAMPADPSEGATKLTADERGPHTATGPAPRL